MRAFLPTVIVHTEGETFAAPLAEELGADGFRLAAGPDPRTIDLDAFDVIVAEQREIDARSAIDEVRTWAPEVRLVSVVKLDAVLVVQAFVRIPGADDLERLRVVAAAVRRATARARPVDRGVRDILSARRHRVAPRPPTG
jgi:hypothetical protein